MQWVVEVVTRSTPARGFELRPKRWIVERTLGWFNLYRRLSKDYEYHTRNSEAMVYVASIRMMLKRCAKRRDYKPKS